MRIVPLPARRTVSVDDGTECYGAAAQLSGCDAYSSGRLTDCAMPEQDLRRSLAALEGLPRPRV
jgi:hypothetical protein